MSNIASKVIRNSDEQFMLNTLKSERSFKQAISYLLPRIKHGVLVRFEGVDEDVFFKDKFRKLHTLWKYASYDSLNDFTGFCYRGVDKNVWEVLVVSTREEVVKEVQEMFKNEARIVNLSVSEIKKTIEDLKREKMLMESYLRLSLRNFLKRNKQEFLGRSLWRDPTSDTVYTFDIDINAELYGYIAVDIKDVSSTVWEALNKNEIDIAELKGKRVLVQVGKKYKTGEVIDMVEESVCNYKLSIGKTLYEYYKEKKNKELSCNERPVLQVKVNNSVLSYPPSLVKLLAYKDLKPAERFSKVEELLNNVFSKFQPLGIKFVKMHRNEAKYVNIKTTGLLLGDNTIVSYPREGILKGAKLLKGPLKIKKLYVLAPQELSENASRLLTELLVTGFDILGFGTIENYELLMYNSYNRFVEIINRALSSTESKNDFIIAVINNEELYRLTKMYCSKYRFHSQIIRLKNAKKLVEGASNRGLSNLKEYSSKIKLKDILLSSQSDKGFTSILLNILLSIYVEFAIQSAISNNQIPSEVAWKLAQPADGEGKTIYIGFDVSRIPGKGAGVIFVLYDSQGSMINVATTRITGEKPIYEDIRMAFLQLLVRLDLVEKIKGIDRLVIFRDGPARSVEEINTWIAAFEDIKRTLQVIGLDIKTMDLIGVVKRHNFRLYRLRASKGTIENPRSGTWTRLWGINRHGIEVFERALVVMYSQARGTIRPIVIERYRTRYNSDKDVDTIVREYISLCKLNFWNIYGTHKLPLPLKIADLLAYLIIQGVDIKIPP